MSSQTWRTGEAAREVAGKDRSLSCWRESGALSLLVVRVGTLDTSSSLWSPKRRSDLEE